MKKLATILFLLFVTLFSCTNRDGEIIDLINSVKKQNEDLKAQITALKKTTDSALVAVLKVNSNQIATDKKIDLIQADLKALLAQIASLNTQMSALNADIGSLKTKIDLLQTKCADLVAQIAALNYNLTSGNPTKIDNLSWTLVSIGNSWRVIPNVDSSILFLSRASDVLKSTNFGTSFSPTGASFPIIRSELGTREGGAFSNFSGGQLVIAGMDKGFYMSNNAVSFASTGPMGFGCGSESILALKDGRFIASMGGSQRGIYKSSGSDNQTWTNKWGGIQLDPRDFSQKNNVIFSATTGGILKSTDQGDSWTNELSIDALDVETVNDSLYFIGNNNFNFYVSKSSTINTNNVRYKFNSYIYDCVYSDVYRVFVAVSINSGIFVSNNRGMSWKQYTIPGVTQYNKITFIKNKIFIATTNGLYVTTL
jgi:prefoldin subunit 5